MPRTRTRIPDELATALESGILTEAQIRQLVAIEAGDLGMSYEDAVERARRNELPKTPLGSDIQFLVMMLDSEPVPSDAVAAD